MTATYLTHVTLTVSRADVQALYTEVTGRGWNKETAREKYLCEGDDFRANSTWKRLHFNLLEAKFWHVRNLWREIIPQAWSYYNAKILLDENKLPSDFDTRRAWEALEAHLLLLKDSNLEAAHLEATEVEIGGADNASPVELKCDLSPTENEPMTATSTVAYTPTPLPLESVINRTLQFNRAMNLDYRNLDTEDLIRELGLDTATAEDWRRAYDRTYRALVAWIESVLDPRNVTSLQQLATEVVRDYRLQGKSIATGIVETIAPILTNPNATASAKLNGFKRVLLSEQYFNRLRATRTFAESSILTAQECFNEVYDPEGFSEFTSIRFCPYDESNSVLRVWLSDSQNGFNYIGVLTVVEEILGSEGKEFPQCLYYADDLVLRVAHLCDNRELNDLREAIYRASQSNPSRLVIKRLGMVLIS